MLCMYRHACGTVQGTFVLGALVCLVGVLEPACTEWQHVTTPVHCSNICGLFGSFSGRFQRGLWGCQYVRHAIGRFQPDVGYDFGPAGLFERQKRVDFGLRGKGVILTSENNTHRNSVVHSFPVRICTNITVFGVRSLKLFGKAAHRRFGVISSSWELSQHFISKAVTEPDSRPNLPR